MSLIPMRKPCEVSWRFTASESPEFINRSCCGSGVKVAWVESTGLAGACDFPFFVINAKLTYSVPTVEAQVELSTVPVTGSSARLSTFNAAHHFVGSQLIPAG